MTERKLAVVSDADPTKPFSLEASNCDDGVSFQISNEMGQYMRVVTTDDDAEALGECFSS